MMKRIAVVLAMVPMLAGATDLAPGTFELSGGSNLAFTGGSTKVKNGSTTDTSDYGLSTTGLYYVVPNLGIGLSLDYAYASEKTNGNKDSLSTFLLGPAIGYEIPVAPEFAVFGRGEIGYVSATRTSTGASDLTYSGYGIGLEAGVKYFPVKNLSFDAGLVYKYTSTSTSDTNPKTDVTTSDFGLNVGLSVYFGGK